MRHRRRSLPPGHLPWPRDIVIPNLPRNIYERVSYTPGDTVEIYLDGDFVMNAQPTASVEDALRALASGDLFVEWAASEDTELARKARDCRFNLFARHLVLSAQMIDLQRQFHELEPYDDDDGPKGA